MRLIFLRILHKVVIGKEPDSNKDLLVKTEGARIT